MNSWIGKMLATTIALSLATILVIKFSPPFSISSVVTQKDSLFTVSGEGKVTVVPDTAIVNLGLTITKQTVKAAQSEANSVINKITADIKNMGVDPKDFQTSNYSINPQYDYSSQPPKITGYQVTASLTVTVKDFDKVNQVIDTATTDGANTVNGVMLSVDETRQKELMQTARENAIKEAKIKAESLAKAAGITLGRIVNVQESGNNPGPVPMMYALDSVAGRGAAQKTAISAGSTDIISNVTLFYETR